MCIKSCARWLSALLLVLVVASIIRICLPGGPIRLVVSRETTRVMEPLRADVWVDYVAAMNLKNGLGVTSDNNGAVLLLQAIGPNAVRVESTSRLFTLLGIAPLPVSGPYLIPFETAVREHLAKTPQAADSDSTEAVPPHDEVRRQLAVFQEELIKGPWTSSQQPFVARWLADNQRALDLVVEAMTRPRFYDPLVMQQDSGDGTLMNVEFPLLQASRNVAISLLVRAMLRTGEGDFDAAWQDLLASHRLARFCGQGPTMIHALVAIAINDMTCRAEIAFVQNSVHDADRIAELRRDLEQLPPPPDMAEKLDVGERFMYLDEVRSLATSGRMRLQVPTEAVESKWNAWSTVALASSVDWNVVMTRGNEWYDRGVAAFAQSSPEKRKAAWAQVEQDLDCECDRILSWRTLAVRFLGGPKGRGEVISLMLASLLMPPCGRVMDASDRARDRLALTHIAMALEAHHADHGAYPRQLADLVPRYLPKVERDSFRDGDFVYKQADGGYLLYGVGDNKTDDGGVDGKDIVIESKITGQ